MRATSSVTFWSSESESLPTSCTISASAASSASTRFMVFCSTRYSGAIFSNWGPSAALVGGGGTRQWAPPLLVKAPRENTHMYLL